MFHTSKTEGPVFAKGKVFEFLLCVSSKNARTSTEEKFHVFFFASDENIIT